jgi:NIMA (never in mitosis gene a)-related kinase
MVMEFADNGDLYEKITLHGKNNTKFTEEEIWSITIQITRGLKALHELKILHRDLKSANVFMFSNGAVKLGDMNVSKMTRNMCKTQTGTPYYASP